MAAPRPAALVGCIIKNSPNEVQFTYDPLNIEQINANTLTVANTLVFRPAVPGTPSAIIGYDYVAKDMTFSKPLEIVGNTAPDNLLNVSTKANFQELRVSNLELGVFGNWGTKTAPFIFTPDTLGIVQMGPQNKIFFEFDPQEYPGPPDGNGVVFINILSKTCSIFLKDITGVRDIPGATVDLDQDTIRKIDSFPQLKVWGIPPDPDGMCRGMLLFL